MDSYGAAGRGNPVLPGHSGYPAVTACPIKIISILALAVGMGWPAAAADWSALPRCTVRTAQQGGPALVIDGRIHSPILFAANNQFGRDEVLLEQIRQAADAGLPLFSFNVPLQYFATPEMAAEVVDRFCGAHPSGYFYIRVWLGPHQPWLAEHPDDAIQRADGTAVGMASPASTAWRKATGHVLAERLREIARGPHGARFIGVCLAYLNTGEWFYPNTDDFMDYSPVNRDRFRAWLREQYRSTGRLRKAWGDDTVALDTAGIPAPELRQAAGWGSFRDPIRHRAAMDYELYQSDLMVETMAYFAKVAKQATGGRSLVGVFYGYTMELNHNGPRALTHSGHLALSKLLREGDIDLIHAPYSYYERKLGEPGHLHFPVDSLDLHGKLAILEEDTFTHESVRPGEELIAPGWHNRTATLAETIAINQRNWANFFMHRAGFWYFDLLSDGRWSDPGFWPPVLLTRRAAAELRDAGPFAPEIAVLMSERAPTTLQADTHPWLLESLARARSEWGRIGAPVGYYLQSDLPRLPGTVKLTILANPYVVTPEERSAIERILARGGTVVWTYAPDIFGPDGADLVRVQAATGMAVEARAADVPMTFRSEKTDETIDVPGADWRVRFVIPDGDVDVLAVYAESGEAAVAAKPGSNGGVVVYSAAPRLPVGLWRWMAAQSGVHLYRDSGGMVAVFGSYLAVHAGHTGPETLRWPGAVGRVERVVPPSPLPLALKSDTWQDVLTQGETVIYRVEQGSSTGGTGLATP